MGFIFDGLESESYDRNYTDRVLITRILKRFAPHAVGLFVVAVALAAAALSDAVAPVIIARAVDAVVERSSNALLISLAAAVFGVGVIGWLLNYVRQRLTTRIVGDVVLTLRDDAYSKTLNLDLSFYDTTPVGKLVSRITGDTQDFSTTVTLVVDLMSELLVVGVLAVYLFTINWWLTLLLFAMAPLAAGIALSFRALARRVTQDARRVTAEITAHIQESIGGIAVAKSFRQEERLYRDFTHNNRLGYRVGLRRGLVLNLIFPIVGIAAGVGTGVIAYAGGFHVMRGGMTAGEWFLFLQAVGFFWWPMLNISSFYSQFQDGLSAAERVFALIDAPAHVCQNPVHRPETLRGAIEFRNVRFAYNEKELVLPDFSLAITPGETVALVGHTGAGKSSIARLVARFYEFQGGQIAVDGYDIRELDAAHYRRQIGIVPQTPVLFSGTVAQNIGYGMMNATEERIRYAASHVGRGDWLADLPDGLSTQVGERGQAISLGQRQLVALARVLLKDPAILILDEATASVDPFTEAQIQEGLAAVMAGRTALVIAHRLSTVRNADRIVVLSRGEIVEMGRHEELLARGGGYAELYETFFRHQSLEYIEGTHDNTI